jgi:hypothetical protein
MFVIGSLMFAGARGWLDRPLGWLHLPRTSHDLPPVVIAAAKPIAIHDGIKLELINDKWERMGRAWIAEVQVRITNDTSPGRVIRLMRPDLESDPGPSWAERPRLSQDELVAIRDAILSRSPLNPHMDLKPRESRIIRVVSHAALPYPAQEGRPYCEFVVTDAEDNEYMLPLTATGSPGSGNGNLWMGSARTDALRPSRRRVMR